MADAVERLAALAHGEVACSSLQRTEAIDFPWPCEFFNQVVSVRTSMHLSTFKATLKRIEREAGRTAADTQRGIVPLDLDILIVDGRVVRPQDCKRPYILAALQELHMPKRSSKPTLSSTSSDTLSSL